MAEESQDERIEREAAEWLTRLNARVVETSELERFFAWRRLPGHNAAYARVETLWRDSGRLAGDADIQAAVEAAMISRPASRPAPPAWRRWPALAMGGGALAALALAVLVVVPRGQTFSTGVGEQRLVRLADGSRVRLDTDTHLTVYLADDRRRVTLDRGQAFFDVAPDTSRPFTVETGDASVTAVGTRFDVRDDTASTAAVPVTEVVLVEGKVDVMSQAAVGSGQKTRLLAGQRISAGATGLGSVSRTDTAALTSWTEGRLEFADTPLSAAIAEINRYTDKPLVLAAPGFAGERVNGGFAVGDTDAFVRAVTGLFPLHATRQVDGSIRLDD